MVEVTMKQTFIHPVQSIATVGFEWQIQGFKWHQAARE